MLSCSAQARVIKTSITQWWVITLLSTMVVRPLPEFKINTVGWDILLGSLEKEALKPAGRAKSCDPFGRQFHHSCKLLMNLIYFWLSTLTSKNFSSSHTYQYRWTLVLDYSLSPVCDSKWLDLCPFRGEWGSKQLCIHQRMRYSAVVKQGEETLFLLRLRDCHSVRTKSRDNKNFAQVFTSKH